MLFRSFARLATKEIEGSSPSFVSRLTGRVTASLSVGTPLYSLAFGAASGVVLSGLVYAGRTLSILLFDHEYLKLQSRKRYFEKQLLFQREQEETASAHYLAALAAEYDPAACRQPFRPLDSKWRF
eukprot:TRINITY_DN40716_c0_g1_i1.p2 TRINITY_DN40716_c0_g1~~TRINITY_DN40716_c0_g1_i1.p2  ORF type:complete len:126 (-),score=23.69 TRINITY_DN40716_c0_g1_i1:58-435(-)